MNFFKPGIFIKRGLAFDIIALGCAVFTILKYSAVTGKNLIKCDIS